MFDIDKFIQECDSRIEKKNNHKAVIDILSKAVENPTDLFRYFGEPTCSPSSEMFLFFFKIIE